MSTINPMSRLYDDMLQILRSMTIKYSYLADKNESLAVRSNAEMYLMAYEKKDTFFSYDDYSEEDFLIADASLDEATIISYRNDLTTVPIALQSKLLNNKREYIINNYEELNDYYRMLNGLPNLDEDYFIFYLPDEMYERYNIPKGIPIHKIEDEVGSYYIRAIESSGYIDKLIEENTEPEAQYLQHLGSRRISIPFARRSRNFAILYLNPYNIMDTTYNEFIRIYEQCRSYFMSTIYVYEYRGVITNYDNFIGLCIFIMTMQQLSVQVLKNATDREFYDVRAIQILYETYGLPFNNRVDTITQKQIAQNVNMLIQRKASNRVIVDLCSILGFNGIEIYEYYLMKKRMFDSNGRPIFKKKTVVNKRNGKEEEVYDYENMYNLYFQRVNIMDEDIHNSLTNALNRIDYYDIVYYDPFWWEDDDLKKEIWETEYNVMESKYLGLSIPYRMTDMIFQSVYLMRMIEDKHVDFQDIKIDLPKITDKPVTLVEVIILMCAMMCKRHHISGMIYTMPSQLIHVMEVLDQDINKDEEYKEVLGFDFDMFSHENIHETKKILERYLVERDYVISSHHDVDIRGDGTQDTYSPTHLVRFEENKKALDEFEKYLLTISNDSTGYSEEEKKNALNNLFGDIQNLYHFLSYRMSISNDIHEIYAIRKFYDAAYYTKEIPEMFKMDVDKDKNFTYMDWLEKYSSHLYEFMVNLQDDELYLYTNHIIYCLSQVLEDVGNLYILNDDLSPLQELLIQLINFFRSFTTDMIDFTMIMLMDWRMENILRLIDHPEELKKVIGVKCDFSTLSYSDFMKKFSAKIQVQDIIRLYDESTLCGRIHLKDLFELTDENAIKEILKKLESREKISLYDTSTTTTHLVLGDSLRFKDDCRVVEITS